MSKDELVQAILALPEEDRDEVLCTLRNSLQQAHHPDGADPDLVKILDERYAEAIKNPARGIKWDQAVAQLRVSNNEKAAHSTSRDE